MRATAHDYSRATRGHARVCVAIAPAAPPLFGDAPLTTRRPLANLADMDIDLHELSRKLAVLDERNKIVQTEFRSASDRIARMLAEEAAERRADMEKLRAEIAEREAEAAKREAQRDAEIAKRDAEAAEREAEVAKREAKRDAEAAKRDAVAAKRGAWIVTSVAGIMVASVTVMSIIMARLLA